MIEVVCAIVEQHGRVLLTQRSEQMRESMLWEFPGGKLEAGETEHQGLVREIKEELGIDVQPYHRLDPVQHPYPNHTIVLIPYLSHYNGGVISLLEHRAYRWATPDELADFNWCPADVLIVEAYLELVKNRG
ncbi:8-oxo-dGTP diphosphatase [Pontibacter chinhatensis]|uniref:8-oxo-dGTP diphosphatase n=2 Tax=Pontibacter chinhatensis TaxID=1436961 RepID=A0A1I2M6U2_9BACT|nr:8-oxo-dGTP diphosphatase [Pontibacter chinhatensis]